MKTFTVWVYTEEGEGGKKFPMAHSLESDTVVSGDDHLEALKDLKIALEMELDYGGNTARAPEELWARSKKEGALVKMEIDR